jgi:hypothetical protein
MAFHQEPTALTIRLEPPAGQFAPSFWVRRKVQGGALRPRSHFQSLDEDIHKDVRVAKA